MGDRVRLGGGGGAGEGRVASSPCIQTENVKVFEEEEESAGRRKFSKGSPKPRGSWEEDCNLPRFPPLQGQSANNFLWVHSRGASRHQPPTSLEHNLVCLKGNAVLGLWEILLRQVWLLS